MNRTDRYSNNKVNKRTERNQELYQDLKDYTNLKEEVLIEPVIEIDLDKKEKKREIKYKNIIDTKSISPIYNSSKKEYDINKIINTAKENRNDKDELEEKRKLKKDEYNITKNIDLNKIDEYKNKDKPVLDELEKEELKDMINTIYSNNLKQEIKEKEKENADLFSDLIAKEDETIIDENLAKELIEEEKQEKTNELKNVDDSFFTKSLGLSVDDFVNSETDNDMDTSFIEERNPKKTIIIISVITVTIIILAVLCYFIYKNI